MRNAQLRRRGCLTALVVVLIGSTLARAQSNPVVTNVYSGYVDHAYSPSSPGPFGVSFVGSPVTTIATPDFEQFGATVNWKWSPAGLTSFGADSVAYINVTTAGLFNFSLGGVQASYLFVDGAFQFEHYSYYVGSSSTTLPLALGVHTVEIQYDASNLPPDGSGQGPYRGYEMLIGANTGSYSFVSAPEPASTILVAFASFMLPARRQSTSRKDATSICGG